MGKTTITLDMLANIQNHYPQARILFISAEMNEIDLTVYVERYPKFQTLPILFVESDFDNEIHNWEVVKEVVEQGWNIVAIDCIFCHEWLWQMFPSKPVVHVIEDSFLPTAQVIELYDIPYVGFEIIGKDLKFRI